MSRLRSAGFVVALVLLVGAVPTLGWIGWTLIRDSKAGTLVTRVSDPRAPGYEAIVNPTPTALLLQKDGTQVVSLTFLALGSDGGGGSAMFLPINTAVQKPTFKGDRFAAASTWEGRQSLVDEVSASLNVGLGDVIEVDDRKWAALTAKSAPIRFDNPDTVTAGSLRFPAGPIALPPEQVGPYLSALNSGESDLNRLNRHALFWQAWLKAIAASKASDVIPGETRSGIGSLVRTLARGPVRVEPLPVTSEALAEVGAGQLFRPIVDRVRKLVAAMVPYPTSPSPGARVTVRLLNGVDGEPIPQSVVDRLVLGGATVSVIGNDHRFGHARTVIQYRDQPGRLRASLVKIALGQRGRLALNVRGSDTADVTVILGRDLLPAKRTTRPTSSSDHPSSVTTTTSTGAGG